MRLITVSHQRLYSVQQGLLEAQPLFNQLSAVYMPSHFAVAALCRIHLNLVLPYGNFLHFLVFHHFGK
jgi:hypothetical protein